MFFQADASNTPLAFGSADLIITDPPFGIGFDGKPSNYNRKVENVYSKYVELNVKKMPFIVRSLYDTLKPDGSIWLISGWNSLRYWETILSAFFFNQLGHVIWKYQFGVYTKKKPVTSHYHLLVYTKNKNKWTWNQQGYDEDVWTIKRIYQRGGLKYPTKLPEKLVEEILIRSSNEGDIVYDPFVGSGTVVDVANRLGRVGIGSDILNNDIFWKPADGARR